MDLAAAGRAALLLDDDLTVATVLKLPLIGLDDDDLLAIAPGRAGSLFDALAAASEPRFVAARERLETWRRRARERTPFAIDAALLGADGGRRALLKRLGPEAERRDRRSHRHWRSPTSATSALARRLPRRTRSRRRAGEARHGGQKRRCARHDRARRQGPRGADRFSRRRLLGRLYAHHRASARPRRSRGRLAVVRLGGAQGRKTPRRSPPRANGRAPPPPANIAACSTSQ